jgi:hypothetical protein
MLYMSKKFENNARAAVKSAPGKEAAPALSCPPAELTPYSQFRTTPIENDENWVRLPKPGQWLCGLTRSHIYSLIARGLIRSVSIRQPHHKRGIRLVFRPSIHAFLAKLDAEQNGDGAK